MSTSGLDTEGYKARLFRLLGRLRLRLPLRLPLPLPLPLILLLLFERDGPDAAERDLRAG